MNRAAVPVNARNPEKITRTVNGVHPALSGQGQIADSMWAWLKFQAENAKKRGEGGMAKRNFEA
jgi:hypothetical protein